MKICPLINFPLTVFYAMFRAVVMAHCARLQTSGGNGVFAFFSIRRLRMHLFFFYQEKDITFYNVIYVIIGEATGRSRRFEEE